MTIGAPRWFSRRPLLAWLARATGKSRAWEARGDGHEAFDRDVRRLASSKGLMVSGSPVAGYTLTSLRDRESFAVQVEMQS